jgi:hypothetical protein
MSPTATERQKKKERKDRHNALHRQRCDRVREALTPFLRMRLHLDGVRLEHVNVGPENIGRSSLNHWPECRACALCGEGVAVRHLVWRFTGMAHNRQRLTLRKRRGAVHDECARKLLPEVGEP